MHRIGDELLLAMIKQTFAKFKRPSDSVVPIPKKKTRSSAMWKTPARKHIDAFPNMRKQDAKQNLQVGSQVLLATVCSVVLLFCCSNEMTGNSVFCPFFEKLCFLSLF